MLPSLSPIILYHHILPMSVIRKNSESAFQTLQYPGYGENNFVCVPLLTWLTQVYNIFGVVRGTQIYKNCTCNGGGNWGNADKNVKCTILLVVMRVRLLQKNGLLDLTNLNQLKKETAIKYVQKVCAITGECN